ncbi:hypothetical protein [Oleidesulfovibrio alaskensis]|jgi:hypothetical protein|uniref:hypothetical protein n=1 Tax=Oleidesulfovibrio alaskensis TaxID=58180 RepID=UPI0004186733|nr:hypothetical protein [Oleidesulfovibrio alaskensis]
MSSTNIEKSIEILLQAGKDIAAADVERKTAFISHTHEGRPYYKGDWKALMEPEAKPLFVNTLSGIARYLTDNPDGLDLNALLVHVDDYQTVTVRSVPTGPHKQRPTFMQAKALIPEHLFSDPVRPRYYPPQVFIPYLQSCFVESEDLKAAIDVCSNMDVEGGVSQADDGLSQKVAVRKGVVTRSEVKVPNPVVLYPFSTFIEIDQPARKMVLRLAGNLDEGSGCALIEADGGAWKISALSAIEAWLKNNLPETVKVIA